MVDLAQVRTHLCLDPGIPVQDHHAEDNTA